MAFLIFSILFIGLLYAHFSVAHMAWSRTRGKNSQELDMDYVRLEDYFGQSFRRKLGKWLTAPSAENSTGELRVVDHGVEKLYVASEAVKYPSNRRERNVLVTEKDFDCGADCSFERELMVHGNGVVGTGSKMQAIAADGTLRLNQNVVVRRWVDAKGPLELMDGCKVFSRVCSASSIYLGPRAEVLSVYAPEVFTESRVATMAGPLVNPRDVVLIPHAANMGNRVFHGYNPNLLFSMGGGSYLYNGDLNLTAPLHIRSPLVVKGNIKTLGASMIEADLKATGSVEIGEMSLIKGNLIAEKNMEIGAGSFFQSVLHAGGEMRLKHGVRGIGDVPVVAFAGGTLTVESNVVVRGKLASGEKVTAVSAPLAWLKNSGDQ